MSTAQEQREVGVTVGTGRSVADSIAPTVRSVPGQPVAVRPLVGGLTRVTGDTEHGTRAAVARSEGGRNRDYAAAY